MTETDSRPSMTFIRSNVGHMVRWIFRVTDLCCHSYSLLCHYQFRIKEKTGPVFDYEYERCDWYWSWSMIRLWPYLLLWSFLLRVKGGGATIHPICSGGNTMTAHCNSSCASEWLIMLASYHLHLCPQCLVTKACTCWRYNVPVCWTACTQVFESSFSHNQSRQQEVQAGPHYL